MKRRGFTMIELMIVVAIISILASIIIPKMTGARDSSKLEACKANLRHIAIAMELYAGDNNGKYTPWDGQGSGRVDYGLSYLTPGYLREAVRCPYGWSYTITANHPGFRSAPAGSTLVYNETSGGVHSPGIPAYCPYYWVGGTVKVN